MRQERYLPVDEMEMQCGGSRRHEWSKQLMPGQVIRICWAIPGPILTASEIEGNEGKLERKKEKRKTYLERAGLIVTFAASTGNPRCCLSVPWYIWEKKIKVEGNEGQTCKKTYLETMGSNECKQEAIRKRGGGRWCTWCLQQFTCRITKSTRMASQSRGPGQQPQWWLVNLWCCFSGRQLVKAKVHAARIIDEINKNCGGSGLWNPHDHDG